MSIINNEELAIDQLLHVHGGDHGAAMRFMKETVKLQRRKDGRKCSRFVSKKMPLFSLLHKFTCAK